MHLGNPEFGCELQSIDFAAVARACGGTCFTIDDPANCGAILDQALGTQGPVVVEAIVDSLEPQIPPKVKSEEAAKLAEALKRGEPDREEIAANIVRVSNISNVRELI